MSREPYCPRCGVVENIHSGVYCSRLSTSEKLNATLRETIHALRAELDEARAVIRNTAETVQAFRLFIPPNQGAPPCPKTARN
jgi:predicted NBD/HSP70 family sugar kinase